MSRKYVSPWQCNARGERLSIIISNENGCYPEFVERPYDPLRPVFIDGPSVAHAYDCQYRLHERPVRHLRRIRSGGFVYQRSNSFEHSLTSQYSPKKLPVLALSQTLFFFIARGHKSVVFLPSLYDESHHNRSASTSAALMLPSKNLDHITDLVDDVDMLRKLTAMNLVHFLEVNMVEFQHTIRQRAREAYGALVTCDLLSIVDIPRRVARNELILPNSLDCEGESRNRGETTVTATGGGMGSRTDKDKVESNEGWWINDVGGFGEAQKSQQLQALTPLHPSENNDKVSQSPDSKFAFFVSYDSDDDDFVAEQTKEDRAEESFGNGTNDAKTDESKGSSCVDDQSFSYPSDVPWHFHDAQGQAMNLSNDFLPIIRPYYYTVLSRRQLSIPFDSPCFSGTFPTCRYLLVFKTSADGDRVISELARNGQLTLTKQSEQLMELSKLLNGRYPQGKKDKRIVEAFKKWCISHGIGAFESSGPYATSHSSKEDHSDNESVSDMILFDDCFVNELENNELQKSKGDVSELFGDLILFDDDFAKSHNLTEFQLSKI